MTQDNSNVIGYAISEKPDGKPFVSVWTQEDQDTSQIEPSNFFPDELSASKAIIEALWGIAEKKAKAFPLPLEKEAIATDLDEENLSAKIIAGYMALPFETISFVSGGTGENSMLCEHSNPEKPRPIALQAMEIKARVNSLCSVHLEFTDGQTKYVENVKVVAPPAEWASKFAETAANPTEAVVEIEIADKATVE
jgi:hypothetical protein